MLQTIFGVSHTKSKPILKRLTRHLIYLIPVCSVIACAIMLSSLLVPYAETPQTYAEEITIPEDKTGITGSKASLTITDLGVTDGYGNTTTVGRGTTAYLTKSVKVEASRISNFELQISGDDKLTSDTKNPNTDNYDRLDATNGELDGASLAENTWGYYYDEDGTLVSAPTTGTKYAALGASAAKIDSKVLSYSDKYSLTQTRNLFFAAKFGQDVVDGEYLANVNLKLVITPKEIVGLESSTYMQEMEPEVCAATEAYHVNYTLTDMRDGGKYTVMRYKSDGGCWMTQNLALDLLDSRISGENIDFFIKNSDVPTDWTWKNGGNINISPKKYSTNSKNNGWGGNNANYTLAEYFVDTSAKDTYGYFYSWCAATANSCQVNGTPIGANAVAESSICPKGWKLPASNTQVAKNDFAKLFGRTTNLGSTTTSIVGTANGTVKLSIGSGGLTTITNNTSKEESLWYAAGDFEHSNGRGNIGGIGYYWSSTAFDESEAYLMDFLSNIVYPGHQGRRYYGFSVRCIARSN